MGFSRHADCGAVPRDNPSQILLLPRQQGARRDAEGFAEGVAEMREIREAEIQCRLGHAADASAFDGLSARPQPLLPNHGHRRFFVAGESTRDGANGNVVRPCQALNVQIWLNKLPPDVIHHPGVEIALSTNIIQILQFQTQYQQIQHCLGETTRNIRVVQTVGHRCRLTQHFTQWDHAGAAVVQYHSGEVFNPRQTTTQQMPGHPYQMVIAPTQAKAERLCGVV